MKFQKLKCTANSPAKICGHNHSSLPRRMRYFCQLERLSAHVAKLDVLGIAWRMSLVCRSEAAADHSLELLSESLVQQRIHKGVDRWIKENQYKSDGVSDVTRSVGGAVIGYEVQSSVRQPTDWKDDADDYDHQSDTLPYLYYSLKNKESKTESKTRCCCCFLFFRLFVWFSRIWGKLH